MCSHRGDSNEYTQHTIFNVREEITLNHPKSAFDIPCVSFLNIYQFVCVLLSLLVLRVKYGI